MNSVTVIAVLSGLIMFLTTPLMCAGQVGVWFSKNKSVFYRIRKVGFWLTILFMVLILGEILMPNI